MSEAGAADSNCFSILCAQQFRKLVQKNRSRPFRVIPITVKILQATNMTRRSDPFSERRREHEDGGVWPALCCLDS